MTSSAPELGNAAESSAHIIVVIDDEPAVANVIAMLLRNRGFQPEIAHSGQEGLILVNTVFPALVICDMRMPQMCGDEVVHHLRSTPHTAHIPVLIISAHTSELCDGVGDAFLQKPFQLKELEDTVDSLIARRAR
jgi:CheY-like chemotaxis protein